MKRNLYLLIILLVVVSCRPVRQSVKTESRETATSEWSHSSETSAQTELQSREATRETGSENEQTDEVITITYWSEPDSLGNQYPVQTTGISRTKNRQTDTNKNTQKEGSEKTVENEKEQAQGSSKNEVDLSAETETEKGLSPLLRWLIGIGIVAVVVVIVFIIYKVRKWLLMR